MQSKKNIKEQEGCYVMINKTIEQEDVSIINIYAQRAVVCV